MGTSHRNNTRRVSWASCLVLATFLVGCGGNAEDAISGFTGGSKSSAKAPPKAAPVPPVAKAPAPVAKPVVAAKDAATPEGEELRKKQVAYRSSHRKDPFRTLVGGEDNRTDLVDLSVVNLVGVAWNGGNMFCVVEDSEGTSYVLRKGDRVKNGRVVSISRKSLVASQSILGYTTTVKLTLDIEKDGTHG